MKYKMNILILLVFSTVTLYGQNTIDVSLLNGEWAGKEIANGNDSYEIIIGAGIVSEEATHELKFLTTNTLSFKENNTVTTHTYTVVDDKLIFGGKEYLVLVISAENLKLQKVESTSTTTLYFDKIESSGY